ncbi:MAG: DUF1385 domain-containing protein [Thermoleophilaceae bacterium]
MPPVVGERDEPSDKLRLGGMALGNGLLVHGPTHWAAAIRTAGGEIAVASGPKPRLGGEATERVPGLRGIAKLGEALAVIPLVKRALPQAQLPMQNLRTLGAMGAAAAGGHAIRRRGRGTLGGEAAIALLSMAPALLTLRSGDVAAYHGVEHKSIAGYEQGAEAAATDKEHDRCGSNLVAPMLTAAVLGNVAARKAGLKGPAAEATVGLGSIAFAVEVFAWSERHAGSPVAEALRAPGRELQRAVGTREPSAEQLEVGEAALVEILRVEGAERPAG